MVTARARNAEHFHFAHPKGCVCRHCVSPDVNLVSELCCTAQDLTKHVLLHLVRIAREAGCKVWARGGQPLDSPEALSGRHYFMIRKASR